MKTPTEKDIFELRSKGKITEGETVIVEGGMLVACELSTNRRRVIDVSGLMLECTKQLLCD